jgi:hypothetical protein
MRTKLAVALVLFGFSSFLSQRLIAGQALAVASNGKWAMVYKPDSDADFNSISAQAISECKAKGGADPTIVWSQRSNLRSGNPAANHGLPRFSIAHGAIAVSDKGTGTIVGWSFNHPYQNSKRA